MEHFANLVAVAAADGYMSAREREFLAERAEENGVKADEYENIVKDADKLHHVVPLNQFQPEDQLMDAIFMSIVDGEIADQEYQLCIDMATRLGFERDVVEQTINEIRFMWDRK